MHLTLVHLTDIDHVLDAILIRQVDMNLHYLIHMDGLHLIGFNLFDPMHLLYAS